MRATSFHSVTWHNVSRTTLTWFVVVIWVIVAAVLRAGGALVGYGLDVRELAVLWVTGVHGVSLDPMGHTSFCRLSPKVPLASSKVPQASSHFPRHRQCLLVQPEKLHDVCQ